MNLEKRIMDTVNNYLDSDKIETVVNEAMDRAIKELFSKYGGLGDVVQNTLKEQMTPIIENHDYSQYALKLEHVLQNVLKEQASDTNKLILNFGGVVKPYPKSITLTDIFNKYCEYVSKKVSSDDLGIDYDEEPRYEDVVCNVTYTEQERRFLSVDDESGILEFDCEQDENLNFSINIFKWSFKDNFSLRSDITSHIREIKYLNDFEVFILGLDLNNVEIILDETDISNDCVEVEARPEASFY